MARRVLLLVFLLSLTAFARTAGAYDFGLATVASAPIGVGCYDIKVADVNGDGRPDAIAAVYDAKRIAVVFGAATGFAAPTFYGGGHADAVDLADYDGDGWIDILEADWEENTVRLWTNDGAGTFVAAGTFVVTGHPRDVASGDFDGDGTRDAVVATGDGRVTFLPGLPGGGFGAQIPQTIGGQTKGVATGDLDNDGDIDVVAIDAVGSRLIRLRNDGAYPFVQVSATSFTGSPSDVALADLDGDGFLDAAASLENGKVATVGGGSLDFALPVRITALTGTLSQSVAIADFDGEGGPDLLVSNFNQSTLEVLRNHGGLEFGGTVVGTTGSNPRSAAAGDFNLDGRMDAVSGDFIGGTAKLVRNIPATLHFVYSPLSLDFGQSGLGTETFQSVTLQNLGNAPLVVTPGAIDGDEFAYAGSGAPISIQAGSSAFLELRYRRTVLGTATGTLHLASNDSLAPEVTIPLTGSTVPANQEITFAPSPLNFGSSYLGDARTASILFKNVGNSPVTLTPGAIDGDEFVYAGAISPFTLGPGGSRNLFIRYKRSVLGDAVGTVHLTTTDPDMPEIGIGLLGNTAPSTTKVAYSPPALDFGTGYQGIITQRSVTLTNIGNLPLVVTPGAIDGDQFVYYGSGPPFTLSPGFYGTITLRCLRTALGDATGMLHVATNDPEKPTIEIPLSATTLEPLPKIAYAPASLDFGSDYEGIQQALQLQIQNVGQKTLTVTPGAIDGDQFIYDFSSAPFDVAIGASHALPIRYLRSVTGAAEGTLHLATNDPDAPDVAIALAGIAAPPPHASFSSPSPIVVSAGTSTPTSFVVRNTGLSPLHVTVPADAGDLAEASPHDMGTTEQEFMRMEISGAMWNLDWEGRVSTGANAEYYWGMDEANFIAQSSGTVGLGGREFRLGPVAVAPGILVTRKIFVPGTEGWVRYVDVAENPNDSPRTATFDLFDNIGYGPDASLRTSDGDSQFELVDDWIVIPAPADRRTVGRMFRSGAGAAPVLASWFQMTVGLVGSYARTKFVTTVPGHGRVSVIQWAVQGVDADATQATLEALHQSPAPGLALADAIDRGSALNLQPDPKAFRPVAGNYVVAPGDSALIPIVFGAEAATHDADLTGTLRVTTDDPQHLLLQVPLAFSVGDGQVVGTDPGDVPPVATLELSGFRPNPMRLSGTARVSFRLASSEPATLTLYDVRGRVLSREVLAAPRPGPGSLALGGVSLKAGVVWMRLEQGGHVVTGKGIVLP